MVKGDGFKLHSPRGSWVRIPASAYVNNFLLYIFCGHYGIQIENITMNSSITNDIPPTRMNHTCIQTSTRTFDNHLCKACKSDFGIRTESHIYKPNPPRFPWCSVAISLTLLILCTRMARGDCNDPDDDECDFSNIYGGPMLRSTEEWANEDTGQRLVSYLKQFDECVKDLPDRSIEGQKPCYEEWQRKVEIEIGPCKGLPPSRVMAEVMEDVAALKYRISHGSGRPNPVPDFDGQKAREQFEKLNGGPMKWFP